MRGYARIRAATRVSACHEHARSERRNRVRCNQWLKWYTSAGGLSQATSKGPKPEAQRADSRGRFLGVATILSPTVRGLGIAISSPAGSGAEPRNKLISVFWGEGFKDHQFCPKHTIHLSFWQPTSMILHSRWAWRFWPGWAQIAACPKPQQVGLISPSRRTL